MFVWKMYALPWILEYWMQNCSQNEITLRKEVGRKREKEEKESVAKIRNEQKEIGLRPCRRERERTEARRSFRRIVVTGADWSGRFFFSFFICSCTASYVTLGKEWFFLTLKCIKLSFFSFLFLSPKNPFHSIKYEWNVSQVDPVFFVSLSVALIYYYGKMLRKFLNKKKAHPYLKFTLDRVEKLMPLI